MTPYQPGDNSKAVCQVCETVVTTTFALRDVPFSDGSGTVPGVLVAICDLCGGVVAIPAQSSAEIVAALAEGISPRSSRDVPIGGKS
jgi:hypothetical protein